MQILQNYCSISNWTENCFILWIRALLSVLLWYQSCYDVAFLLSYKHTKVAKILVIYELIIQSKITDSSDVNLFLRQIWLEY